MMIRPRHVPAELVEDLADDPAAGEPVDVDPDDYFAQVVEEFGNEAMGQRLPRTR